METTPSSEPLVDGAHVTPANGGETASKPAVTLEDLNKQLGSDFKDVPTALKALKDTKDFVGKRKDDIAAELQRGLTQSQSQDNGLKSDVQALKDELFLSQNPQYKDYVPLLKKISGDSLAEAVNSTEFKAIYERAKMADDVTKSKSVVSSNARLSQSKTVTDEAVNVANARGTTNEDVATILARGITDALNG